MVRTKANKNMPQGVDALAAGSLDAIVSAAGLYENCVTVVTKLARG
jgi:hypothetical protein